MRLIFSVRPERNGFSDISPVAVGRAKDCIMDTLVVAAFGAQFPWSRMVADYARRYGSGGTCSIIGSPDTRVYAPCAALAWPSTSTADAL